MVNGRLNYARWYSQLLWSPLGPADEDDHRQMVATELDKERVDKKEADIPPSWY